MLKKWRIKIEKKTLILINSGFAISFINQETNRRYLRYLTESKKFSFGTSLGEGVVTIVGEDSGEVVGGGFSYGTVGQGVVWQGFNSNILNGVRNVWQQESSVTIRP